MDEIESDPSDDQAIAPNDDPGADVASDEVVRVVVERLGGSQDSFTNLGAKFDQLRIANAAGTEHAAKMAAIVDSYQSKLPDMSSMIPKMDNLDNAKLIAGVGKFDMPEWAKKSADVSAITRVMPKIDRDNMPDARAARAAEQTAAHLEVLVDAALQTEARESEMLRLSKTNTTLAAIAAVASIVSIVVAIVLALILG